MTGIVNESLVMLTDSVFDEEVITYYDDLPSDFEGSIICQLQPPSTDVVMNLDLTENSLEDLVTLTPAVESSESFNLTATNSCFLANSDYSPSSSSSFSWCSPENPGSVLYSPSSTSCGSEENTDIMVSPSEVLFECQAPLKKKRGRKPKFVSGSCNPTVKTKRLRVYEIDKPFDDKEKEKKRVNAIKAKKHRDSQKQSMQKLQLQIDQVKAEKDQLKQERDRLKREVESLRRKDYDAEREMQQTELEIARRKVAELTRKCEFYKRHWESKSNQIMKLLLNTPEF